MDTSENLLARGTETRNDPESGRANKGGGGSGGGKTCLRSCVKLWENASDPDFQFTCLLSVGSVTLFVALFALPALALSGFERGWAYAQGDGFDLHLGWKRGCVRGFREVSYNATDTAAAWVLCERGTCHNHCSRELVHEILQESGSEWIGLLFPTVYLVAIVLPLVFCIALPRLCRWGCERGFGRSKRCDGVCLGHFFGLSMVLFVQAAWVCLGALILAMSILFVHDANGDIVARSRAAVNVVCDDAGQVCGNVKSLEECDAGCVLAARGVVDCLDVDITDICRLEAIHRGCDQPGVICQVVHSWAFYCATLSGGVLILSALTLSRVLWTSF